MAHLVGDKLEEAHLGVRPRILLLDHAAEDVAVRDQYNVLLRTLAQVLADPLCTCIQRGIVGGCVSALPYRKILACCSTPASAWTD